MCKTFRGYQVVSRVCEVMRGRLEFMSVKICVRGKVGKSSFRKKIVRGKKIFGMQGLGQKCGITQGLQLRDFYDTVGAWGNNDQLPKGTYSGIFMTPM